MDYNPTSTKGLFQLSSTLPFGTPQNDGGYLYISTKTSFYQKIFNNYVFIYISHTHIIDFRGVDTSKGNLYRLQYQNRYEIRAEVW